MNISNFYRIKVCYKGTNYFGWQIQKNEKTIQGEINHSLEVISKTSQIKTIGAGRTDAGVHALGQVFRAEIPLNIPTGSLKKALNSNLPRDIRIVSVEKSSNEFHPIYSASSKEYVYVFSNLGEDSPFLSEFIVNLAYSIDFNLMAEAAELFVGEKDFCNFYCTGTKITTTVRKIFECELVKSKSFDFVSGNFNENYIFRVRGNGFLKQMVRLMVGALWNIGRGKITISQLKKSLDNSSSGKIGPVVLPDGLYLKEVFYLN